jgi:hypothetical protein
MQLLISNKGQCNIPYNFRTFISHLSQPICGDTGNTFFSILAGFWRFEKKI